MRNSQRDLHCVTLYSLHVCFASSLHMRVTKSTEKKKYILLSGNMQNALYMQRSHHALQTVSELRLLFQPVCRTGQTSTYTNKKELNFSALL